MDTEQTTTRDPLTATCRICKAHVSSVLIRKDGMNVLCCRECGLAFTHPQPRELANQYDSAYFDLYRRRRQFRLRRADARLKRIELLMSPGKLLDIGCSLGYFVEAANSRGWKASGVEISEVAAGEAREMQLDVRAGTLEGAAYADGAFDCVTMWDVLEHVPDPVAHMLEVRRVLSAGGLVVVGTPDLGHLQFRLKREQWRHLKPAEHIFYFTQSSIERLMTKTGFSLVRPPLLGGRLFPGSLGAAVGRALSDLVRLNDVMTVYGVKNELQIPKG